MNRLIDPDGHCGMTPLGREAFLWAYAAAALALAALAAYHHGWPHGAELAYMLTCLSTSTMSAYLALDFRSERTAP